MKLIFKIIFGFILIILLLALANIYSTSYVLKDLLEERLKTGEVVFAKSLSNRLYRKVIEAKTFYITDVLFDEKTLRESKVEYILIFDEKGYLLSHTYLSLFPKQLLKLKHNFKDGEKYRLEKIQSDELSVYNIAVPIMEGIRQVGTIHLGIKSDYIQNLITTTKTTLTLITLIVSFFAILIALFLSKTITNPTLKLKILAEQISMGKLDKHIEIKSRDEIGDLARTFNLMTRKLKISQDQLIQSEKLSAMGQLSAGLAHELNSPLTGLISLIRKYRDKAEKDSEEHSHMKLMSRACEHMAKIVKDFGSLSRKSKGQFIELNINDIIESTLSFIASQFKLKAIKIHKEYADELPEIRGNKTELQQVVLNILTNAKDSIHEGGDLHIKTNISEDKNNLIMQFIDNGYGIKTKYLSKIFDPFFTTKPHGEGVGLGLSVAYGIIKNHGGDIKVSSEFSKGTSFSVFLPAYNHQEGE